MLGGELNGPADLAIVGVTRAGYAAPSAISFAENKKFLAKALSAPVGALLVPAGLEPEGVPFIVVPEPRLAFGFLLGCCDRLNSIKPGVHPTAVVHASAKVDSSASVGPYAVIEADSRIGARTRVYPFAYVGERCLLGDDCVIHPHAVLVQDVQLGNRCMIHSGTVLGADGFGYVQMNGKRVKVPQVGGVILGDDVEIGAVTAIDRATAGDTLLGRGSKIDNLVQIAHNVEIGEDTVVAALTGLPGSARIGNRVTIGGAVSINVQGNIADDVTIAGRSIVISDVKEPGGAYFGWPAQELGEAMRTVSTIKRLPEMMKRLQEVERELEQLKKCLPKDEPSQTQ